MKFKTIIREILEWCLTIFVFAYIGLLIAATIYILFS